MLHAEHTDQCHSQASRNICALSLLHMPGLAGNAGNGILLRLTLELLEPELFAIQECLLSFLPYPRACGSAAIFLWS